MGVPPQEGRRDYATGTGKPQLTVLFLPACACVTVTCLLTVQVIKNTRETGARLANATRRAHARFSSGLNGLWAQTQHLRNEKLG